MNDFEAAGGRSPRSRIDRFRRTRLGLAVQIALVMGVFALGLMIGGGGSPAPSADSGRPGAEEANAPVLWTCSMHPQIQLPKPGKCPICFMDLIPVETGRGSGRLGPRQIAMSEAARRLARIETAPVRRADAEADIRLVGQIDYDETRLAYIAARVPGRIDTLFADYTGVTVRRGAPLVSLYSPDLLSTQQELLQAKNALAAAAQSAGLVRATAESTLAAARERLRLWGLTAEQIERIEAGGQPSDHLTILSPISGTVIEKEALEGEYVETGMRIYTVADLSRLWVILEAYESDLPWLREGQRFTFTAQALPGETFSAVVSFIDPVIDPESRTARVRAAVDNAAGRLKPKMFVSGEVAARLGSESGLARSTGRPDAPLLIPTSAPLVTGTRAVVYVKTAEDGDGPVYEGRDIVLGPRAGDFYVVANGLAEGEEVVSRGAFKIDAELQIQAKPSMMSPAPLARRAADSASVHGDHPAAGADVAISPDARASLSPLYEAYFEVQMALAKDQFEASRRGLDDLAAKTAAVDMSLFAGRAHALWMDLSRRLQTAARAGAAAGDIAAVRNAFRDLSATAIDLHRAFGHADDRPFYLTYCPMAFHNTGAYWLQTEGIVWNSYWGAAMLQCGEIRDTLPALSAGAGITAPDSGQGR